MNTVQPIPPGMTAITPHLVCRGAADAIAFYARAFGAVELGRLPAPDGRLMHAMIRIGDASLMLVDEFPEQGCLGPSAVNASPVTLHLYVADADATMAAAVAAGATVTMPLADMFWGDRYGIVVDPSGHRWSLATRKKVATAEEIRTGSEQHFPGKS